MNNKEVERRIKALASIRKQKEWGLHSALQISAEADRVHEFKKGKYGLAKMSFKHCQDIMREKYNQENTYIDLNELNSIKQNLIQKKDEILQFKEEIEKAKKDLQIAKSSVIGIKKSIRILESKEHNQKKISIKNMIKDSWKEMDESWLLKVFK